MSDLELKMDGEPDLYADKAGTSLVIRFSKTASGALTYTVGATMGIDADVARVMSKIVELNDAAKIVADHETKTVSPRTWASYPTADEGNGLSGQLRQSILVERIKTLVKNGEVYSDGWVDAPALIGASESRNRVIADLQALVKAGVLEYRQGGGRGKPSQYRFAGAEAAA